MRIEWWRKIWLLVLQLLLAEVLLLQLGVETLLLLLRV